MFEDTQAVVVADVPETDGTVQRGGEKESALGPREIHNMRLFREILLLSLLCGH